MNGLWLLTPLLHPLPSVLSSCVPLGLHGGELRLLLCGQRLEYLSVNLCAQYRELGLDPSEVSARRSNGGFVERTGRDCGVQRVTEGRSLFSKASLFFLVRFEDASYLTLLRFGQVELSKSHLGQRPHAPGSARPTESAWSATPPDRRSGAIGRILTLGHRRGVAGETDAEHDGAGYRSETCDSSHVSSPLDCLNDSRSDLFD
jgi:hypothetical protein